MSDKPTGRGPQPTDSHRGLRLLALTAVVLGLLLLVAAAFVLSYAGIHAIALSAGVSPRLARLYPLILDAMLVIAFAAVLSLRGAGVFSRLYAWLSMLVLLAAAAAGGAAHATNVKLPHKPAAAAAAIVPWALVLIGFGLLLTMLRQARLRRLTLAAAQESAAVEPTGHVVVRHGIDDLLSPKRPADAPTVRYGSGPGPAKADPAADPGWDLAIDTEPGQDDPASDEAHVAAPPANWNPRGREEQPGGYGGNPAAVFSPAPTVAVESESVTDPASSEGSAASSGGAAAGARPAPAPRPAPSAQPAAAPPAPVARPASGAPTVPTARPASSNGSKPAVRPARKSAPAPGVIPEARVAPEDAPAIPAPEPKPAASTTPAAAEPTAETPATTDDVAESGTVAEPTSAPASVASPELTEDAEAAPEAEAAQESQPQPEPEPASGTEPASRTEAESKTETPPALPRFNRVRSSPEPPEA